MTNKIFHFLVTLVVACAAWTATPAFSAFEENTVAVHEASYGPHQLKADVYEQPSPLQRGKKAAVLLIHGGGWGAGSRTEFKDLAKWLAQQGAVAIAIDYRLTSSGAQWPAQARDVEEAVWWIRENADKLQIDPNRVVAIGGSAGGHLAAWLATTDQKNAKGTSSRVNLLVSIWGPWDLTVSNIRPEAKNMIASLMGDQSPKLASPLAFVDGHAAPALLVHGTQDDLVPMEQATRACDALHAAKVTCELMLLEGVNHRFTRAADIDKVAQRVKDFIASH